MGIIIERQKGIGSVGEMITALQKYSADMPLSNGTGDCFEVFRVKPQDDEIYEDERGKIQIHEQYED